MDSSEVMVQREDGFVDLNFPIASFHVAADGALTVVARGILSGATVGFMIEIAAEWTSQDIGAPLGTLYSGTVTLRSLGAESDRFVAVLADLYEILPAPQSIAETIHVLGAGLGTDPRLLSTYPVKMKLFLGEGDNEEHFAEVFTNIDLQSMRLQFNEKDTDYRASLIRALHLGASYSE